MVREKHPGFIIEDPLDLFYLTGLNLSRGMLLVCKKQVCLFVDGRYLSMAKERAKVPVRLVSDQQVREFLRKNGANELIFDSARTSFERHAQLKKSLKVALKPKAHILQELRAVKNPLEIEKLKESARLNYAGYEHILKLLKVGISERALATEFEIFCLKQGGEKPAFEPIIAFGKNSALPHHRASDTRLKKGDIVLFDLGVMLDGYASDMTRIHFFGKAAPKLQKFYEVVRSAHRAALALCKPGTEIGALDEAARQVMAESGLEELFVHSLGHGIGLEVHEFPLIRKGGPHHKLPLREGMAITIEPGLYLPGLGGVRYEDTVLIAEKGYVNLYPEGP